MAKRHRVIGTTTDVLAAAEARLGRPLPPSFRAWLLEHNGSGDVFPVPDVREPRTLTGNVFDERDQLQSYVVDCFGVDPATVSSLLPVAAVGDGDVWCLDLGQRDGHGEARVVRWLHETGEMEVVAASFDEFLASREAGDLDD